MGELSRRDLLGVWERADVVTVLLGYLIYNGKGWALLLLLLLACTNTDGDSINSEPLYFAPRKRLSMMKFWVTRSREPNRRR